jgi:ribosome biogenesis protein Nip4
LQDDKRRRLRFTAPSEAEDLQIREGLTRYISKKAVNQLLEGQYLVIGKGRRNEVFLLSPALKDLYQQMQPQHPYFVGIFLGELRKQEFHPSLHVLPRLADAAKSPAKVIATSKGEQRFLYGHSLNTSDLQGKIPESGETKKVLVVNDRQEGIGYGQLMKTAAGEGVLKNELDLGWYLRRGR